MQKDKFVAIAVGQGDAFWIERGAEFTALVDGGKSIAGFAEKFKGATQRDSADVVICSHNDADHANGIIGLLQSGLHCKEIWLPASWLDRLNDLFHPDTFIHELIDNINELHPEAISPSKPANRLEQLADTQQPDEIKDVDSPIQAEDFICERDTGEYVEMLHSWPVDWYPLWSLFGIDAYSSRFQLFREAMGAADRILQISQLAFDRGCRVRWFDYSKDSCGGIDGMLVPVNSCEVSSVNRKPKALIYLALTVSNRRSLVFHSSPLSSAAVLFTADSDLDFPNQIKWSPGMIITAPHHGSEANAKAYQRFKREMPQGASATWVRSDGRFPSRPGTSFLGLRTSNTPVFCTLCRRDSKPKQDLTFDLQAQWWNPINTRACACA